MYKRANKFFQRGQERIANSQKSQSKPRLPLGILVPNLIRRAYGDGKAIRGKLMRRVKGGYKISIEGFSAFCPESQMYPPAKTDAAFEKIQNKTFQFLVIDIKDNSVVLSRRKALGKKMLVDLKNSWYVREPLRGVVKTIKDFGVFVDLGAIDGLIHISNLSGKQIGSLKTGDSVSVVIENMKKDGPKHRISLKLIEKLAS